MNAGLETMALPNFAAIKARQKAIWESGDYGPAAGVAARLGIASAPLESEVFVPRPGFTTNSSELFMSLFMILITGRSLLFGHSRLRL